MQPSLNERQKLTETEWQEFKTWQANRKKVLESFKQHPDYALIKRQLGEEND